jgi:hypothetical protein
MIPFARLKAVNDDHNPATITKANMDRSAEKTQSAVANDSSIKKTYRSDDTNHGESRKENEANLVSEKSDIFIDIRKDCMTTYTALLARNERGRSSCSGAFGAKHDVQTDEGSGRK